MDTAKPKVALGANTSQYIWSTRSRMIKVLMAQGYDVVVMAPRDAFSEKFATIGADFIEVPMKMNTNPMTDLVVFINFICAMRQARPAAYLGFTVKPNVYGSLAANLLGVPVINNIAGLGATFVTRTVVTRIVKMLYRAGLSRSTLVFFQNEEDCTLFQDEGILHHKRHDILPGSGVDIDRFEYKPLPAKGTGKNFRFLLISRMLWDKGIGEFVEAARELRKKYDAVEFCLLGSLGIDNPACISEQEMQAWIDEGLVTYLGFKEDVISQIIASDCVVLPSYREGTPRTLLEACATGRPIITTDAVGCRNVVDDMKNGMICEVKNSHDLAQKMTRMLLLTEVQRQEMGRQGRQKMEHEYDERIVIQKYLDALEDVT